VVKKLIKFIKKNEEYIFPILDIGLNGVNYLVHVFISYFLLASDYGVLNSVLAIMSVLFVIGTSVQIFAAKNTAIQELSKNTNFYLSIGALLAIFTSVLFMVFMGTFTALTRATNGTLYVVVFTFVVNVFLSIYRGVLQGKRRFIQLNISFYLEVISKLLLIGLLLPWQKNIFSVLFSIGVGMTIALAHGIWAVKRYGCEVTIGAKQTGKLDKQQMKNVLMILLGNMLFYYISALDMLAINYYFPNTSGDYAVSLKYSQVPLFVSVSIMSVFLPYLSKAFSSGKNKQFVNYILYSFMCVVPLCLIALVSYQTFLPSTVGLLFGKSYEEGSQYMFTSGLLYTILCLIFVLVNVQMVMGNRRYLIDMLTVSIAISIGFIFIRDSIYQILMMEIGILSILFLKLAMETVWVTRKFKKEEGEVMMNLKEKNKKVLLFLSWRDIKHPKKGGAEVFTHEALRLLDKSNYRVIHISPYLKGNEEEEEVDGILYIRKGSTYTVILHAMYFYLKNKKSIDFVIDQCNTHHFFTPLWVKKQKRVFFIHQFTREIWCMNMASPICKIGEITESPLIRLSKNDHTITVSRSTQKELKELGFDANKIQILPEGIGFSHWDKKDFLKKEPHPTFVYVGRYVNYKGIDDVVEAYARIKREYPTSKLWIIGEKDGVYIDSRLKPIFEREGISYGSDEDKDVVLWGFVSNEKKLSLMSKADALIFPSKREGWGLIITEAAAVGTPSIAYHSPGIVDALDYGNAGYLCEANKVEYIVKNMRSVIEDKEIYEQMREKAYNYSLKFHWQHTAMTLDLFFIGIEGAGNYMDELKVG
jgi:glycosyltransferase involved in cell wall biosynthesis/O-antigen/teichoic acid export membrane protein